MNVLTPGMLGRAALPGLERLARSLGVSAARRPAATYRARLVEAILNWEQRQRYIEAGPKPRPYYDFQRAKILRHMVAVGLSREQIDTLAPWASSPDWEAARAPEKPERTWKQIVEERRRKAS